MCLLPYLRVLKGRGGREALPVAETRQNGKSANMSSSPFCDFGVWFLSSVVAELGTGPTVPCSTLLREPVLVCVTWPTNCFPTRLSKATPGTLWKSLPRHASKIDQAF